MFNMFDAFTREWTRHVKSFPKTSKKNMFGRSTLNHSIIADADYIVCL